MVEEEEEDGVSCHFWMYQIICSQHGYQAEFIDYAHPLVEVVRNVFSR